MTDSKKKATDDTTIRESTPERFTLKTGTVISVEGVEVRLVGDTEIESDGTDHDKLAELTGTTFAEYPKRVTGPDGVEKNVNGPEEEAAWLNPPPPAKKASPLDDVTIHGSDDDADEARRAAARNADRVDSHKKK